MIVNERVRQEHHDRWKKASGCRQTKEMMEKSVSGKELVTIMKLSRKELRWIMGNKTGHVPLQRHLNIMKVEASPTCPKCGLEDETPLHHCGRCPVYAMKRLEHLGAVQLTMNDLKRVTTKQLLAYLKDTKRLEEIGEVTGPKTKR